MESSNLSSSNLILEELKRLNKLMGVLVTQGRSPNEKILLLNQVGLSPKEIAETLGVSSNLVSVTIYNEKKKKKKKK
jgi:hypothetical protein